VYGNSNRLKNTSLNFSKKLRETHETNHKGGEDYGLKKLSFQIGCKVTAKTAKRRNTFSGPSGSICAQVLVYQKIAHRPGRHKIALLSPTGLGFVACIAELKG